VYDSMNRAPYQPNNAVSCSESKLPCQPRPSFLARTFSRSTRSLDTQFLRIVSTCRRVFTATYPTLIAEANAEIERDDLPFTHGTAVITTDFLGPTALAWPARTCGQSHPSGQRIGEAGASQ
ncbi:hypothetical protein, partial [Paraburkholderia hospita]|uniref:hypothetical protein n=1 Tax=Paraburkholderia hospita TaxID=169430 RepID=UPI001A995B6C